MGGVFWDKQSVRIDPKFFTNTKSYLLQSLYATLAVFLVMMVLRLQDFVIIASLGATAFIIFAIPSSTTARARNVIGGHLIGLAVGSLLFLIPHNNWMGESAISALSVGITFFLMVISNTEHPPAAATALGMSLVGFSWPTALALLLSAGALSTIQFLFRKSLQDLR